MATVEVGSLAPFASRPRLTSYRSLASRMPRKSVKKRGSELIGALIDREDITPRASCPPSSPARSCTLASASRPTCSASLSLFAAPISRKRLPRLPITHTRQSNVSRCADYSRADLIPAALACQVDQPSHLAHRLVLLAHVRSHGQTLAHTTLVPLPLRSASYTPHARCPLVAASAGG